MTVQIWETTSQTRGIITLQADIVAACWVKYDAGLLVLCSDGSTHIWTQAVSIKEEDILNLISFMNKEGMAARNIVLRAINSV